jgi:drug/metabolite transporter (DMT)-like permease
MSPWLTLSLAVLFVSFGAVLVRLAAAPPLAVSFYRMAIASLILLPFAQRDARRAWPALDGRRRLLLLASGLALALHFATWIASLSYTTVASSVLLVNTAPLFAIVLSRLFLREKPPLVVQVAIPIAFAGAALIAFGDWTGSPGSLLGNGLALAGAVNLAVYQVVGRGLRDALPLNAYVLGVWSAAACVLAVLARSFGRSWADTRCEPGFSSPPSPSSPRSAATASRTSRCARSPRRRWASSSSASRSSLRSSPGSCSARCRGRGR